MATSSSNVPRIVHVGPGLAVRGGVSAVERLITDSISRHVQVVHVATAEDGVAWIAELVRRLEIPPLRSYGVSRGDIDALADKASQASSMKGNPVDLRKEDLCDVISRAI